MARLKTSFITTVYNEEKTITQFLESLFSQSVLPDEIIIVDAGSTDRTIELISSFLPKKENTLNIKLLFQKGNRSVGRNTAIVASTNEIILCSDAGCILDKDWVKNIVISFKDTCIDVVGGFYKPLTHNVFEKCLATYTSTMPDKIDTKNFLPSSRSVAFKKSAWEKAGKYPEYLDTCEDLVFDKNLKKMDCRFVFSKEAYVYWPQRKNLFQAVKQFFSYAKGDGEAHFFRKQTPLLFLRYLFAVALVSLGLLFHKSVFLEAIPVLFILYILWSIGKNYKYVLRPLAMFWLPVLQFTSDFAVMLGTVYGFYKSMHILKVIANNKIISLIIFFYLLTTLSSISWGIPNISHPFTYHMDEWAQAQSIRSLFRHGTPNINGSSHGVIFEYFLTGIYLVPFIVLHLVNPFIIRSPFDFLDIQQRLFIILRFNTILNGIIAIIVCSYIAKRFLNISAKLTAIFLTVTPLFILPSMIFKYDLALACWLSLSILFTFLFAKSPTKIQFLLMTGIYALTLSIKLSALPLIPLFVISFFLFYKNPSKNLLILLQGLLVFLIIFLLAGIPDLVLGTGNYSEWLRANLITNPFQVTNNLRIGNIFLFLSTQQYPALFGHVFYVFFLVSILFCIVYLIKTKKDLLYKQILFLLLAILLFAASLLPLQIGADSNRLLVFLPFLSLIGAFAISKIYKGRNNILLFIVTLLVIIQVLEVFSWVSVRIFQTPRESASLWIQKNIPQGSTIGIENVPIFQSIPDILLKDFYHLQYYPKAKSIYSYSVLDSKSNIFPKYVILSDLPSAKSYFYISDAKTIYEKLSSRGYKPISQFTTNMTYYSLFNTEKSFYFGAIVPTPIRITIYSVNNSK